MKKITLASLLLGLGIAATPVAMADSHRDRDYRGDRHERLERQERHERQERRREFRKERREHMRERAEKERHFVQRRFEHEHEGPRFRDRHDWKHYKRDQRRAERHAWKHYKREQRRAERHAWKHHKREQRRAWKHYKKHHQPYDYDRGYGWGYYQHRGHHEYDAGKYYHRSGRHDSTLPIIAGGVIGGLVGSDLGHGDPAAATRGLVVGSVLGYALTR